ncbi:MAG: efflux RND transporter periplasmic adaptor subunit [Acidobacteriota bacterium]
MMLRMMLRAAVLLPWLLVALACGGPEAAENTERTSPDQARLADGSAAEEAAERAVAVEVLVVETQTVIDRASLSADVRAARRANLAAEVAGTVERLPIDEGDAVGAGDVLAAIDTRALEARLAEARAVDRQRQLQFERAEKLLEKRSITRVQFLDAVTNRDVAAAQLASAELELDQATVRAPWAGTVATTRVEEGDYVVPGQAMIELVDVSRLEVVAPAPAGDVPFLQVGASADVRVDVFPDRVFPGRVSRLAAELDASARTLDVVVNLDLAKLAGGDGLRPGLPARIELVRRTLDDVIVVPLAATVELDESRAIYVVEGGHAVRRPVRLGPIVRGDGVAGDRVVIEDGLVAGDRLVLRGQRRLSPGQAVTETVAETPSAQLGGGDSP